MALLTPLPLDRARQLMSLYGLELESMRALSEGSVNSNFFFEAKSSSEAAPRSYFARIYEEQGESGARFELTLNERLAGAGLPVARPIRREDGGLHCDFDGKPFAVYERLQGEVLCQKRVTPEVARSVGAALAGVHLAPLGDLKLEPSRFGFPEIEERLQRVEDAQRDDLYPAVAKIRQLSAGLKSARRADLPGGLIHGDLFRDNALIGEHGRVSGLLDFESASEGAYAFDLMVTLLAWCFGDELDLDLTTAMVAGYHAVRPLIQLELDQLVVEGSIACIRFASTRLTDFSLRAPAGEKPGRDYGRFFQRLDALASGQLDRAISGLI